MKIQNAETTKNLKATIASILADEATSKSAKMKALFTLGLEVKEIATLMNVRYNFVYNVVSNMVIVEGIEVEHSQTTSKRDVIAGLAGQGKTAKEIAIELKTNMNYVYKILNELKQDQAVAE